MDKELIKGVIKEMIRDGEIVVVWDIPLDRFSSVEDCGDVEDMLEWVEFRLVVGED